MIKPYFCDKCNFETDELIGGCPRCGSALRKTSTVQKLGWVLVVLGGLLTAFMSVLIVVITRIINNSDEPGTSARFTGDATAAGFIYAILGVVLALSITFVVAGIWQIRYGRRNKKLVFVALVLAALFYAAGEAVEYLD